MLNDVNTDMDKWTTRKVKVTTIKNNTIWSWGTWNKIKIIRVSRCGIVLPYCNSTNNNLWKWGTIQQPLALKLELEEKVETFSGDFEFMLWNVETDRIHLRRRNVCAPFKQPNRESAARQCEFLQTQCRTYFHPKYLVPHWFRKKCRVVG